MINCKNLGKNLLIGLVLVMTLQGCDRLSSLFGYFEPKSKAKAQPQAQPYTVTPAPISTQTVAAESAVPAKSKTRAPNVIAEVGGWTLTKEDFKERLAALKQVVPDYDETDLQAKRFVLEEIVRQQLLVQDAVKQGVDKKKEIAQAVEEFRNTLLVREMATRLTKDVTAGDDEAQQYYEQNKFDFMAPAQWRIREIVFDSEDVAKETLIELYKGADFVAIATERSIAESAPNGGDLGLLVDFDFPKMENAVKALEVGDISSVFRGPQGFYIVKLEEKNGGEQKEFEEIKDEIKTGLTLLKQQQIIAEYLQRLQLESNPYINEALLKE